MMMLERGMLMTMRMLEIGKVERVEISPDGTCVYFTVFIEEDYVKYIK